MCNLPTDEGAFSVVSDANFIFYILEALFSAVEDGSPDVSRNEKFEGFIERLHRVLEGVASRTTQGKLLISSAVYQEEVSPANPGSALRRKLGCIDTMCAGLREKYEALDHCLLNHLMIVDVPEGDVQSLMQYFHAPLKPKDRDAGLLLLALRQCGGTQTFLLTDDTGLTKACDHLVRRGQTVTACGTFETGRLDQVGYMDFLKWAHDKCHITTEEFISCFSLRLAIEQEGLERVGPSGRRHRVKQFDKAAHACMRSAIAKGQAVHHLASPQAT